MKLALILLAIWLIVTWAALRLVSINKPTQVATAPSWIANRLYALTARLRCRLINRHGPKGPERYLERYHLAELFGGAVTAYLHRFVAEDADEWVHDHPWRWSLAIVLTGGYVEERLIWFDPLTGWAARWRRIGGWRRLNLIRGGDFHRITKSQPETWTLFIHGPRVKGWGFLSSIEKGAVYHQPHDVAKSAGWAATAPLGNDAERAPLMGDQT